MLPLVRQSLSDPRHAALRLLAAQPSIREGVEALLLVAALGGLLVGVMTGGRLELPTAAGTISMGPMAYAATLFVTLTLGGAALALAGRTLGGGGDVAGALALVAWLQVLDLVVQAGALLVEILVPPLGAVAALVGLAVLLWCLVGFVRALHGFGTGRAVGTILIAALGLGLALAVLLGVLGVGVMADA